MYKNILSIAAIFFLITGCDEQANDPVARSLEYQSWEDTEQPVGSAAYLGLGTWTKRICTAIFESRRKQAEFIKNGKDLILPTEYIEHVRYTVDTVNKSITTNLGDSIGRTATYFAGQGCILDVEKGLFFDPVDVVSSLPPASDVDWPMGDLVEPVGDQYNPELLQKASDAAFHPEALTAAFLVIHNGNIIIERYRDDITSDTQLESWSMGKSLAATLIGQLIHQGKLSLDQKAPVAEWQQEGDPRAQITIRNLLQMSSGLRFPSYGRTRSNRVAASGSYDGELPLAQLTHIYPYTGSINVFDFAVNRPLEFVPGSLGSGQYRNSDPLTLMYIFKTTVEGDGRNPLTWPQEELFDQIGIRRQLLETDRFGNFIISGYDYGTARNWGRLGLLYLQDGVWGGMRLLPEGYSDFVSTHAQSWEDPVYGAMFWLNRTNLPVHHYSMNGGGGQSVTIAPELNLVVVRLGHSGGKNFVQESLNEALAHIAAMLEQMENGN